jgi:hypothetical protein
MSYISKNTLIVLTYTGSEFINLLQSTSKLSITFAHKAPTNKGK